MRLSVIASAHWISLGSRTSRSIGKRKIRFMLDPTEDLYTRTLYRRTLDIFIYLVNVPLPAHRRSLSSPLLAANGANGIKGQRSGLRGR
jgi:hypothetical protein